MILKPTATASFLNVFENLWLLDTSPSILNMLKRADTMAKVDGELQSSGEGAGPGKIKGKSERTRELIVQRALHLFQKNGYESVTMRDLAEACDLSLGSFYYHFENKEEIILQLFKDSLDGHIERTEGYLAAHQPRLESAMVWICRDRFAEFTPYRDLLRVLVQKLDPHDPISPWHRSSHKIREQSVVLFESVVECGLPKLDTKSKRQLARALWLQHLMILAVWSFDRSQRNEDTELVLKQSVRLWKSLPSLVRVPGMKSFFNLVLSPLERIEMGAR